MKWTIIFATAVNTYIALCIVDLLIKYSEYSIMGYILGKYPDDFNNWKIIYLADIDREYGEGDCEAAMKAEIRSEVSSVKQ